MITESPPTIHCALKKLTLELAHRQLFLLKDIGLGDAEKTQLKEFALNGIHHCRHHLSTVLTIMSRLHEFRFSIPINAVLKLMHSHPYRGISCVPALLSYSRGQLSSSLVAFDFQLKSM